MFRPILCAVFLLILPPTMRAQHAHGTPEAATGPAMLLEGLGEIHHPTSTRNPEAQQFFDQGLALAYGFNHDAAERSFRRAAELDPEFALAHWGVALVNGPNYNAPADPERSQAAYAAIQKALALAPKASPAERAYIRALAVRYSSDPNADAHALEQQYMEAMGGVMDRYPDDLDAATLYAEAGMNLRPWRLWSKDYEPAPGTEEILAVLQSVLQRNPRHSGANHLYIHAVEASRHPERALPSANIIASTAPAAGHLVHMAAHIYLRVGDWEAAVESNRRAAEADRVYLRKTGAGGVYKFGYYPHNMHFEAAVHCLAGRFSDAMRAARQLEEFTNPHLAETPSLEIFSPTSTFVLLRFHRWEQIMRLPEPDAKYAFAHAVWQYARGMALVGQGTPKLAELSLGLLTAERDKMDFNAHLGMNTDRGLIDIAVHVLSAKIAAAHKDTPKAEHHLRAAVEAQDDLIYIEPPEWYYPVRESLGALLLAAGRGAEAEEVFREDLERNPRNPRSLFGLMESLKAQGREYDAELVRSRFEAAWRDADTELRLEDL